MVYRHFRIREDHRLKDCCPNIDYTEEDEKLWRRLLVKFGKT
jgi:hypothetical protein